MVGLGLPYNRDLPSNKTQFNQKLQFFENINKYQHNPLFTQSNNFIPENTTHHLVSEDITNNFIPGNTQDRVFEDITGEFISENTQDRVSEDLSEEFPSEDSSGEIKFDEIGSDFHTSSDFYLNFNQNFVSTNFHKIDKNPKILNSNPKIFDKNPKILNSNPKIFDKNPKLLNKNHKLLDPNPNAAHLGTDSGTGFTDFDPENTATVEYRSQVKSKLLSVGAKSNLKINAVDEILTVKRNLNAVRSNSNLLTGNAVKSKKRLPIMYQDDVEALLTRQPNAVRNFINSLNSQLSHSSHFSNSSNTVDSMENMKNTMEIVDNVETMEKEGELTYRTDGYKMNMFNPFYTTVNDPNEGLEYRLTCRTDFSPFNTPDTSDSMENTDNSMENVHNTTDNMDNTVENVESVDKSLMDRIFNKSFLQSFSTLPEGVNLVIDTPTSAPTWSSNPINDTVKSFNVINSGWAWLQSTNTKEWIPKFIILFYTTDSGASNRSNLDINTMKINTGNFINHTPRGRYLNYILRIIYPERELLYYVPLEGAT